MNKYEVILFDLDGTLTDSGKGILNAVKYSLNKFNIEVKDHEELKKFIGPPLLESFQEYYNFSKEKSEKAVQYYREYYKDKGLYENEVYEGIEELLKKLKGEGYKLIVATSKPEVFAKKILNHFNLSNYFTYIAGADLEGKRGKKDKVIEYALKSCNIIDYSKVVMVGDREYDILGAKKNNIHSIGVLFGYGSRNELENAKADYIAENPERIFNIVSGK